MLVLSPQQARQQVRAYATDVAQLLGTRAQHHETALKCYACQGRHGEAPHDGRFYAQGNYRLPLPAAAHTHTLTTLHASWRAKGYRIRDFRTFANTEGTLLVENPADEVQISLESSRPPLAMTLLIHTPCYPQTSRRCPRRSIAAWAAGG